MTPVKLVPLNRKGNYTQSTNIYVIEASNRNFQRSEIADGMNLEVRTFQKTVMKQN